jgi:hypothetical protein
MLFLTWSWPTTIRQLFLEDFLGFWQFPYLTRIADSFPQEIAFCILEDRFIVGGKKRWQRVELELLSPVIHDGPVPVNRASELSACGGLGQAQCWIRRLVRHLFIRDSE